MVTRRRIKLAFKRLRHLPGGRYLWKYLRNKVHSKYLRMIRSSRVAYPSAIMFEVTNLCNLKCISCPREYSLGEAMQKGNMELAQLKKIVDETFPYVDSIGLSGLGETLIYKDIQEACAYIRSKSNGIIQFISINAHLPNCVDTTLALAPLIDSIQISIDGIGQVFETIRPPAKFDAFMDNVKAIVEGTKEERAQVSFNMVVFDQNYRQMAEVVALAHSCGIRFVNFNTLNLVALDRSDTGAYDLYQTDAFREAQREAEKKALELDIEMTSFDFETAPGFQKCNYPWDYFYISWDGYLVPCCAKPFPEALHFGNVFTQGLMNCLNSDKARDFRRKWYKNETPDFCEQCHFIEIPATES